MGYVGGGDMTVNLYEQFLSAAGNEVGLDEPTIMRMAGIMRRVKGYSDGKQYAFFRTLLSLPDVRDVLILGVYHGRDIAFMRDCLVQAGRTDVRIVGVDKFSDTPCADWPEGSAGKRWEDAGFGEPPTIEGAMNNIGVGTSGVLLVKCTDEWFLRDTTMQFDAVYLDTSHDHATVARQISQVRRVCRPDAIICGDDYSDESNMPGGEWGVKRAVQQAFTRHTVFANWIWISSLNLLKTQPCQQPS